MALLKKWIQKGSERELTSKKEGSSGSTRSVEVAPVPPLNSSRIANDASHPPATSSMRSARALEEKPESANTAESEPKERQLIERALIDDGCLVYTGTKGEPKVKGGTLDALVRRLTAIKYADPSFTIDFLLTYRSFTTPRELLTLLSARFSLEPPLGTSSVDEWRKNTLTPIRLKVAAVLKNWLSNHWHDFEADDALTAATLSFLELMAREGMRSSADALRNVIERKKQDKDGGSSREVRKQFSAPPPAPVLTPALLSCMSISGLISLTNTNAAPALQPTDLDPLETARQMALIDQELFCAIRPFELLKQAWTKQDAAQRAPNILRAIERFNQITGWVATEILILSDASARLRVMAHFVDVCQHLADLNDLFGTMAVMAGFGQAPIFRLKEEPLLSKKHQQKLQTVRDLMSREKSFANYRNYTSTVSPPLVPYLGAHLTDLVFLEDGNKDELDGNSQLINFDKRYMISQIIRQLQTFQNTPYCLEPVPYMIEFLRNVRFHDDATLHELSSKILPRTTSVRTTGRLEISGSSGNLTASSASLSTSAEKTEGATSGGSKPGSRIGGRPENTLQVPVMTSPITSPGTSPQPSPHLLSRQSNEGTASAVSSTSAPVPFSAGAVRVGVSPGTAGSSTLTRTSHGTTIGSTRALSPHRYDTPTTAPPPSLHHPENVNKSSVPVDRRTAVRQALAELLSSDPNALLALFREDMRNELTKQTESQSTRLASDQDADRDRRFATEMSEFQTEVDARVAAVMGKLEDVSKALRSP